MSWPAAELDPVRRLHVLAAGLRGSYVHEQHLDAPFDAVWEYVRDLERSAPTFDSDVSALRVLSRDGERWEIEARLPAWAAHAPLRFDVTMRSGWCWMVAQPRVYVVGMAARAVGGGTLFAHLEGVTLPTRRFAPLARPLLALSRLRHRHHVPRDVARLASSVAEGAPDETR